MKSGLLVLVCLGLMGSAQAGNIIVPTGRYVFRGQMQAHSPVIQKVRVSDWAVINKLKTQGFECALVNQGNHVFDCYKILIPSAEVLQKAYYLAAQANQGLFVEFGILSGSMELISSDVYSDNYRVPQAVSLSNGTTAQVYVLRYTARLNPSSESIQIGSLAFFEQVTATTTKYSAVQTVPAVDGIGSIFIPVTLTLNREN